MAYKVEYKIIKNGSEGTEIKHVKKTVTNPSVIAQLVQDATEGEGTLEFLTVRRAKEKAQ